MDKCGTCKHYIDSAWHRSPNHTETGYGTCGRIRESDDKLIGKDLTVLAGIDGVALSVTVNFGCILHEKD